MSLKKVNLLLVFYSYWWNTTFQKFIFYCWISLFLVTVSLLLFSLCVLSDSWELTKIRKDVLPLNKTNGGSFLEIVKDRIFIVNGDSVSVNQPWHQSSLLLATTHSGLWRTCLDVSQEEYRDLLTSFPWLGDRCISLSHLVREGLKSDIKEEGESVILTLKIVQNWHNFER